MILFSLSISVIIALTPKVSGSFVCCPEHATKVNTQINIHNAIIIFFIISSSKFRFVAQFLYSNYTIKYHKTCEQFYRNFGIYEKSPNSFLPGLPHSIVNQFDFHNFLCLCLASVHLPYPFHLVSAFCFSVTPFRFASSGTISSMRFRAASSILAQYRLTYIQQCGCFFCGGRFNLPKNLRVNL